MGRGLRLGVLGSPNIALQLSVPLELHGPFGVRKTGDRLLLQVDALARAITSA